MFDLAIHNALPLCKVPAALSTGHGRSMRLCGAFFTRWPSRKGVRGTARMLSHMPASS